MSTYVGLNLSPSEDMRAASLPLFEAGVIDAIQWSLDLGFPGIPPWVQSLLEFYGAEGRLSAHGVEMSLFTAGQTERRDRWVEQAVAALEPYAFKRLSEHFGLMTAGEMVGGTPFPHPYTTAALDVGHRHIDLLRERTEIPIGLENLALALSPRDVDEQPDFIDALLEPSDGFLLLDLHNLLCQAENFDRDPLALLARYPLERAKEIHLAGGNQFVSSSQQTVRRDDHERALPAMVFTLLEETLRRTENIEFIFLEYADYALRNEEDINAFHRQVRQVQGCIDRAKENTSREPYEPPVRTCTPVEIGGSIAARQAAFFHTLDEADDVPDARKRLAAEPLLAPWSPWIESMIDPMFELGMLLIDRWGERHETIEEGQMNAATLRSVGRLDLRPAPIPTPGPGQVRLRVEACGVCGTDVAFLRGRFRAPLPLSLGHEAVGIVDAIGGGVKGVTLGSRLIVPWAQGSCGQCEPCRSGQARVCRSLETWVALGGGFARFVLANAAACVEVPKSLHPAFAAPLACAGHTVYSALDKAGASRGKRVAVHGIGGLGHLALQIAAARGCEVFALTSNPTKVDDARRFGAHDVLVGDRLAPALADAGGADIVLITSSSLKGSGQYVGALRAGGTLVLAGVDPKAQLDVSAIELTERNARVTGAMSGGRKDLKRLLELAAKGSVTPVIERYPLPQLRRALYRLEDRRVRYRAVITP